ncbi:hypothetical protein BBO_09458 [Beauveria brongniartii RCEF 3172]|uniref:BTB/POZ fold protein n=1 Tax=Beauveria brongniartii RCEF 3172 TaxID=1081107 RepID=A0A166VN31_9HYPO|nr:hypothetical protein BBO_09458 [Beauveria brongniartii RCEF 3172]
MSSSSNHAVSTQYGLQNIRPENLKQILCQGHVVFTVGSAGAEMGMHTGIVQGVSASLHLLVANRHLSKHVELRDVEEDIFLRFCQFCYTGTYEGFALYDASAAEQLARKCAEQPKVSGLFANIKADQETPSPIFGLLRVGEDALKLPYSLASFQAAATGWADPNAWCSFCKQNIEAVRVPSKRRLCSCGLKRASYNKLEAISSFIGSYKNSVEPVPQVQQESLVVRYALIGHARVWNFAQQYGIPPLMKLACKNMVHELTYLTISALTFMTIVKDLIHYVYGCDTTEGHSVRQLLAQFAACVADDVIAFIGWAELLERVPAFARDYAYEVTRRLA